MARTKKHKPGANRKREEKGLPSLPKKPGQKKTQKANPKALKPKSNSAAPAKKPEPTIPFHPEDRILLIGEGDFSFAKNIVEHHGCCDVTATCLDSREDLFQKYKPQAEEHIKYLEEEGQQVVYGVDATKLDRNKQIGKLKGQGWDHVLFNFPHVGGKSTDVNRQVRFNQELLASFFRCAAPLLKTGSGGESSSSTIVVTLFEGEPYTLWNIRDLARHSGLKVERSFKFLAEAYPGYSHARTLGNIEGGGGWKGEEREARSYVFAVKDEDGRTEQLKPLTPAERKRKAKDDESDEDQE
jgi:25S rRNA (uracil2634-N3)-methyltransferase